MTNAAGRNLAEVERSEVPQSAAQVVELLADAAREWNPVRIAGGNGASALGNSLRPVGWSLATTRLNRVLAYEPTDMTLSVEAGARLGDVSAQLAEHGQMLPVEAVDPTQATIGGLLATGLTGPRRYGGGTLRDVLIGIAVAYPDGTIGKAGGMVVKNVSGFDMMRVHYGAMGTLGVIVSANFKLLPVPRSEFTALATYPELVSALAVAAELRAPAVRPVALVVRQIESRWELAARYEGRNSGLQAVRAKLARIVAPDCRFAVDQDSSAFWSGLMIGRQMVNPQEARLRITVAPTALAVATQSLWKMARANHRISRFEVEPGIGMITLSLEPSSETAGELAGTLVLSLRRELQRGVVTIMTAPDAIRTGLDIWGHEPETIAIMRALKREFDPSGILNPGIFAGGI